MTSETLTTYVATDASGREYRRRSYSAFGFAVIYHRPAKEDAAYSLALASLHDADFCTDIKAAIKARGKISKRYGWPTELVLARPIQLP